MNNLGTLLKRLEAATSRLEDIATAQAITGTHSLSGASALHNETPRIGGNGEAGAAAAGVAGAAAVVGTAAAVEGSRASAEESSASVKGFDELVKGPLQTYLILSQTHGGLVAQQSVEVQAAFKAQRAFLLLAAACTKLSSTSPAYATILGPTQKALMSAIDVKEKNRGSKDINMLSTVSEGIGALGWVTLDSKPGPYVGDMKDSSQFYANRVLKENKETNPAAVEWSRSFITLLEELRKYIMQYHTTGLSWNPKGVDPGSYVAAPSAGSSAPAPPPPPPPPATVPSAPGSINTPVVADMGGVFASLNKGESVTKGLKKVDKSEMTHKNPELRAAGVVPSSLDSSSSRAPPKPSKPASISSTAAKRPAVTTLEGNKWIIENHENNPSIKIEKTEINQIVNVFNVKNSVIQISGKLNAVSLVNCTKTSVLLNSIVSSLSVSSCPSFTVQILGKVPTILIDGTDGGQVFLGKDSLDVEIITSKTSSINISLPVEGEEEGVFQEKAVPEQLKTIVKSGKLITIVVEHAG